jgi:Protein of unknown function (DUF2568)
MAALGVWGWQVGSPRWLLVVVLPLLAMTAWWLFASPRARFGSGGRREVVKVLVFGLASWALWDAGHHGWAIGLLVLSVVVNAVALMPPVAAVAARETVNDVQVRRHPEPGRGRARRRRTHRPGPG